MKIVYFGTGAFGVPSLDVLERSPHEILAVVTSPDKPQGRNLKITASPVKQWAAARGIRILQFSDPRSSEAAAALKNLQADAFVVIAYGFILSPAVLALPQKAALNVHSSLLPRYRGPAPIHWALLNGDAETGVTVMRLAPKLDAGDIAVQKKTKIEADDDIESLEKRLASLGAEALLQALTEIDKGSLVFRPQNEAAADYARKITKEDGRLDWTASSATVRNRIRALVRWPKAHSFYSGKRIIFLRAEAAAEKLRACRAGEIVQASAKEGLVVAAADGLVRILELQAEGKNPLPAGEFLKGFPLQAGTFLE